MASLEIDGKDFKLTRVTFCVVGSASRCDIVLNYPSVDDKHALLHFGSNGVHVLDLQTKEGTYVADERVISTIISGNRTKLGFGEIHGILSIYPEGHPQHGK